MCNESQTIPFIPGPRDGEVTVSIQYWHQDGIGWIPWFVHTAQETVRPTDKRAAYADRYDFNWCKRDKACYYHLSGCGSGVSTDGGSPEGDEPKIKIWFDAARVTLFDSNSWDRDLGRHTVALTPELAASRGFEIIPEPLPYPGTKDTDPFRYAIHGGTIWCNECEDDLPCDETDAPCCHVWHCEIHNDWGGATPDGCGCTERPGNCAVCGDEGRIQDDHLWFCDEVCQAEWNKGLPESTTRRELIPEELSLLREIYAEGDIGYCIDQHQFSAAVMLKEYGYLRGDVVGGPLWVTAAGHDALSEAEE